MSKEAIQAVVQELESLPEADQQLVLTFLGKLKQNRRNIKASASDHQSALSTKGGLLVFTGQLEQPDVDWVRVVRDEHDQEAAQLAYGRSVCS